MGALDGGAAFCDGIGLTRTPLTQTERQVRELFQEFGLKLFTVVAKDKSWFVKLDEDAMAGANDIKDKLKKM